MSSLVVGTNAVSMDEPCYSLKELELQSPGSRGWRRYQIITVIRSKSTAMMAPTWRERPPLFDLGLGCTLVEFRRDLGPAKAFTAPPVAIPGGIESNGRIEIVHTVGELYDIAELVRSDAYVQPETPKPADLIQGYHDSFDKKRLRSKRRSIFSRRVRVQRS